MKEELKKQYERVSELEKELEKQTGRSNELEKELKEKESKFLDLYMENSTQHDKILELTNILESERDTYALTLAQAGLSTTSVDASKKPKKLKNSQSTVVAGQSGSHISSTGDDSELILSYEKRLSENLMTITKMERDLLYKDEEMRSLKNIARDVAEQLELVQKREADFKLAIVRLEEALQAERVEAARVKEEGETKVRESVEEAQRAREKAEEVAREKMKEVDVRLEYEAKIDRKETRIH